MNERPRRRRSDDDSDRGGGGGLPLFPLILIVIFAGLLLGGALAHFFGRPKNATSRPGPLALATATPTPAAPILSLKPLRRPVATPSPSSSPAATPPPHPSPAASPTPRASHAPPTATPLPTHSPAATPSAPAKTQAPSPAAVAVKRTPVPQKAAVVTAAPNYVPARSDQAAGIVRSYLGALARGDRATATSYLAHGLPGEVFMDQSARILSVRSTGDGAPYHVSADVQTTTGEYYLTFTLEPGQGGLQIIDHYAIKVH